MANQEQLARLQEHIAGWNEWRQKNAGIKIDLSGANLDQAYLSGANLSLANLSLANLSLANLSGANLSGANLRAYLSEAKLRGANFSGANLSGANLIGANLSGANFSGTDLSGANFRGADLSGADLSGAKLSRADLSGADLSGADLSGADLIEAKLSRADLSGADLIEANLIEADLSGANLIEAKLSRADLSGADLSGANLSGANLSGANLIEANLIEANLIEANLIEANLIEANLIEADLSGANLDQAKALNTNFTRANLTGACIQYWNINQRTIFEEVICDYIYYKFDWETKTYQERRPRDPNKIFNPSDLQRLIETARETVDLIFSDGIDWKAFLESFHGLQIESENGELSIAGILKKRDGTFVIQIDAPQDTDKADLENRFYQVYEQKLALIEQDYQAQLANKEQEITNKDRELLQLYREKSTDMTEIAKLLAENSNRNTYIITEAKAVANSEINNIKQAGNFGVGVNQGEIQGNAKVAGILNEAEQQNLTEIITEVQAIIAPLTQTYPNNPTTQGIKAIEAIEKNPNLKQKLIEAAKKGGLEAFKKSLDNPVGAFIGGAIEGWMGK